MVAVGFQETKRDSLRAAIPLD